MGLKKTIIYMIGLALLVTYLSTYGKKYGRQKREEHVKSKMWEDLPEFDIGRVETFLLVGHEKRFHISNESGRWMVKNGHGREIDRNEIKSLLRIFRYGYLREFQATGPDALKEYGLDKPEIVLIIKLRGSSEKKLLIGKDHVSGLACYALREDMARIFLIGIAYKQEIREFMVRIDSRRVTQEGKAVNDRPF